MRGVMLKAAFQNTKKRHKLQSSQKNLQAKQHPLIRVGRKNKRGVLMKAAIQNKKIKEIQVYIIKEKYSTYTPPSNQG